MKKSLSCITLLSFACMLLTQNTFGADVKRKKHRPGKVVSLAYELRSAIHSYNSDDVESLIEQGADANEKCYPDGPTPLGELFQSSPRIHSEPARKTAEVLIGNGANVNGVFYEVGFQTTPLLKAIAYRCPSLVRVFLDNGANVHFTSMQGNTPLRKAVIQCMSTKRTATEQDVKDAEKVLTMVLETASPISLDSYVGLRTLVCTTASNMADEDAKRQPESLWGTDWVPTKGPRDPEEVKEGTLALIEAHATVDGE